MDVNLSNDSGKKESVPNGHEKTVESPDANSSPSTMFSSLSGLGKKLEDTVHNVNKGIASTQVELSNTISGGKKSAEEFLGSIKTETDRLKEGVANLASEVDTAKDSLVKSAVDQTNKKKDELTNAVSEGSHKIISSVQAEKEKAEKKISSLASETSKNLQEITSKGKDGIDQCVSETGNSFGEIFGGSQEETNDSVASSKGTASDVTNVAKTASEDKTYTNGFFGDLLGSFNETKSNLINFGSDLVDGAKESASSVKNEMGAQKEEISKSFMDGVKTHADDAKSELTNVVKSTIASVGSEFEKAKEGLFTGVADAKVNAGNSASQITSELAKTKNELSETIAENFNSAKSGLDTLKNETVKVKDEANKKASESLGFLTNVKEDLSRTKQEVENYASEQARAASEGFDSLKQEALKSKEDVINKVSTTAVESLGSMQGAADGAEKELTKAKDGLSGLVSENVDIAAKNLSSFKEETVKAKNELVSSASRAKKKKVPTAPLR